MKLYTSDALLAPSDDHIRVWRAEARLASTEACHVALDDARWLLMAGDDDDDPVDVCEQSRINTLAVIAAYEQELQRRERLAIDRTTIQTGVSQDYISDVKARVRIEDEIGMVRTLQRRGALYVALCPFHDDRIHPNLVIWPDRQRFQCFACMSKSGDVVDFVQLYQRIGFRESIEYLAARGGVPLPHDGRAKAVRRAR